MGGLRRICKALGGMTVTGNDGTTIEYVWDYVADEPVTKQEMPPGSERWKLSERARWLGEANRPSTGASASREPQKYSDALGPERSVGVNNR